MKNCWRTKAFTRSSMICSSEISKGVQFEPVPRLRAARRAGKCTEKALLLLIGDAALKIGARVSKPACCPTFTHLAGLEPALRATAPSSRAESSAVSIETRKACARRVILVEQRRE